MNFIAYKRVSTKRQGDDGYGLGAQDDAVRRYVEHNGGKVIAEYQEVESGRNCARPELTKALAHAKRSKATLIVAKLDRLSRNVAFLSALMESKVPFVACDNPHATTFTLHVLAAAAEHEAKQISERTKAGLAVAKSRGVLLGSARPDHWKGRENLRVQGLAKGREVSIGVRKRLAREAYTDIVPLIREQRASGMSYEKIAQVLNETGHTTRRNKTWKAISVWRVLAKVDGE